LVVDSQQGATLNAEAARQKLGKRLESMHPDGVALDSANHLLKSFCEWLPSAHNYRHGQKEGPPNPPLDFAVHIVSAGMTWTRWLTEMYLAQSPASKK
jgi:hypothetical protein